MVNVDTDTQGESHKRMKAEIRVILLQTNRAPEAGEEAKSRLSLPPSAGTSPANIVRLNFCPLARRDKKISIVYTTQGVVLCYGR